MLAACAESSFLAKIEAIHAAIEAAAVAIVAPKRHHVIVVVTGHEFQFFTKFGCLGFDFALKAGLEGLIFVFLALILNKSVIRALFDLQILIYQLFLHYRLVWFLILIENVQFTVF